MSDQAAGFLDISENSTSFRCYGFHAAIFEKSTREKVIISK